MITINIEEYLKAKKIVVAYEKQLEIREKALSGGDIYLPSVLGLRTKNMLLKWNESREDKDGEKLLYASGIAKLIREDGRVRRYTRQGKERVSYYVLRTIRGIGVKGQDEILSYVAPFL